MPHRETLIHRNAMRRAFDKALLGGVSLLALMMGSGLGEARSLLATSAVAPTAVAQQAALAAAQQAAGAGAQAQASLARAAAALAAARQLQLDAAAAARALPSSVPDGLTTGGLMPAGGTASDPWAGIRVPSSKWVGGDLPTQSVSGSQVTVGINQTQQKGIFYWDTFNVGANTTVNFTQSGSDWIALNRVLDPSAVPSRILGQINAFGSVYLINRNGIIFGAGSQIDVHTLVASSLDIGVLGTDLGARDNYFLTTGIANLNSFSDNPLPSVNANAVAGDITVQRGASIKGEIATDVSALGSAPSVYLFGANVTNSGSIMAPTGEVGLVAARTIDLVPNGYSVLPPTVLGTDTSGNLLTFRGTEFRLSQFASSYDATTDYPRDSHYLAGTGVVTHDGLITASRGIVIMNGDTVSIDNPRDANGGALRDATGNLVQGVISVDTSIDRNSMVLLRAATSVSMNGVISSLPFDDGAQPLPSGASAGSTVQSFTPAYIEMTAQSTVTVGASGLVSAPSAQVALNAIAITATSVSNGVSSSTFIPNLFNQGETATGGGNPDVTPNSQSPETVRLAPGAIVDVAGLANVQLPASYNFIAFKPLAEFADMPLQRSGPLYGQTLWIDIRASGTRSDGTSWVGTPLADASGTVNAVGRSIYQLMTVGGSVSQATDLNANAGVQTAGSVINVAGGNVTFLPGMVNTTRLIGADGRIYSMANADPNMTYLGIAGQFTVNHSRWGVTETWSTGTQTFAPGYTEGHDAGGVIVNTVNPSLDGTMYFGSVAGERQIGTLPLQGSLALTTPSSVQIGPAPSADYTAQSASTTLLSADTLSGYGLSALTVTANDFVVSGGSTLNLAPGGSLSVTTGGAIDIAGTVSAAGGAINLVTDRLTVSGKFASTLFKPPVDQAGAVIAANVFVEGTLDVSGRFVNDSGRTGAGLSGPAFINGGTISITTNKDSESVAGGVEDTTGSILLAKNSVLDVSSGGYVSPQGKPKTASTGVMAGKAGAVSLAIYQGKIWGSDSNNPPVRPTLPALGPVAVLELDGSLLGYGFESNGSLRLAGADTIRIGGSLQPTETSAIRIDGAPSTLPVSLLTGGGFGAYTIESVTDDWSNATANVTVSAGVNLTLRQQNLSSLVDYSATATGTRLSQQATPALALLPDDQRKPVNLTLRADNILLDTGAMIATDPKASITFGNIRTANGSIILASSDPTRNVAAQNVELLGSIVDHGGSVFINALKTHLGPRALVDLSGTFVANSRFGAVGGPATSGTYLSGGTFTVEAGQIDTVNTLINTADSSKDNYYYTYDAPGHGYLVADIGATVDVSGSAGMVQVAGARGATTSLWSWSDAGTVSADVTGFAWGGSFVATGGRYFGADGLARSDPRANNGTFILGGGSIFLRQDTTDVQSQLSSLQSLFVAADQLAPFDNIFLYSGNAEGGAARYFNELPAYNRLAGSNVVARPYEVAGSTYDIPTESLNALTITGSLNWHVENGLRIAAGSIASFQNGNAVALDAPYVLLTGGGGPTAAGSSTLKVSGQTIDVEGASLLGFAQASLISSGDIRLSTPKVSNSIDQSTGASTNPASFTGSLASAGDLLLSAQRIYPVTAVDFTITTPGNVTFAAPAGSNTAIPLAAGGSLTVIANSIDQAGNLFAPLGKITLGNTDSTVSAITTQSVVLEPGSLTSVTLADTIVPYGATADGTNWFYNANLNPLSQPPSKGLVLAGTNVTRSDGSTIDLRGGGDLQAMEWIQGKGGSRDTLTTTPSGQTVYALLPSQSAAVSAFDIQFTAARSAATGNAVAAGDVDPLAGTQITIAGGNGIPAGTYTLYPAHYATLPGALRVVYYGDNTGRNIPTGTTLPDGTVLVSGHYTQSTSSGKQSSGNSLFAVQTSAVWQQYSEYTFNRANSYFTQLAAKQGTTVPRLPMDAGRLSVFAEQSILLAGIALTQPGQDSSGNTGRGGELDISAPQMVVVGHTQFVDNDIPTGYVGLDVTQLNGFESILIGGQRSDTATGTLITPTASSVVVDTRSDVFTAPEILLVAAVAKPGQLQTIPQTLTTSQGNGQSVDVEDKIYAPASNSGTVRIAAGSVIVTTGIVHAGAGRNYYFAAPTADFAGSNGNATTAQDIATALGGTLDATGTVITGADVSKLDYFVKNADGSFVTNPDGSLYRHAGTIGTSDLVNLQNYSYQTMGLGALFAATNDTSLKVSGPTGVAPASLTIQFKQSSDPNAAGAINGSLLLPADAGRLTIETGASITAKAVTLQATASTNAIVGNSADLHLQQLNVVARSIGLGSPSPVTDKSVALYNQQFADVQAMSLKALSGVITVYGGFDPGAVTKLTLDAAAIVRADSGGSASVSVNGDGSTITLVNSGAASGATSPASIGGTGLNFNATDIVLGGGSQTMLGYSQVNLIATDKVLVAGPGSLTLGTGTDVVGFNVATRSILVAGATSTGSGSFAVSTRGNIVVSDISQPIPGRPADSTETGGNLSLTGANIVVGTLIQAQAGTIALEATTGDVSLAPGAYLAAGGFRKTLVDVDTYLSGGKVVLTSDKGNVYTDGLSVIDVAQSTGGLGYGGEIDVTAPSGNATLAGALRGGGGPGLGGRFTLDIKGAADLTALADNLLAGGVTGAIDIQTRTGNLELSQGHTLKANAITLTADDTSWDPTDTTKQFGQAIIEGAVDASGYGGNTLDGTGQAGGQVAIYGANQVKLAGTGVIDASTTHADERGGDVTVGIGWSAQGNILLQTGTQINVSGGTKGGLSGGTVTFSAPLDGNNDVKIWAIDGNGTVLPTIDATNDVADRTKIGIIGARSVTVDGFVAFDTHASSYGINGSSLGWSGIIDPAGWYNTDGTVATTGSWANVSGFSITGSTIASGFTSVPADAPVFAVASNGKQVQVASLTNYVMGLNNVSARDPGIPFDGTQYNVTFNYSDPTKAPAVAAQGTVTGVSHNFLTFVITNPGSGFVSAPSSATITSADGSRTFTVALTSTGLKITSAQIKLAAGFAGVDLSIFPKVAATVGTQSFTFAVASNFSGKTVLSADGKTTTFVPDTTNYIPLASSDVYAAFDPTKQGTAGVASFTGSDSTNRRFFANTLTAVTQGTFSDNGQHYGFTNLFSRLQPLVADLGADVVHVQPGVELVNSTGDITVKTNWNLAAGKAGNLQTAKNANNNQSFQYFDPAQSYVNFNYRLTTPWGIEAGALTLRASGDINVNASISDGFFQFGNYLDPTYTAWVGSYLSAFGGANNRAIDQNGGLYTYYLNNVSSSAVPIAPYQAGNATALQDPGNAISPTGQDLATADLFPHTLLVCTANCSTSNPTLTTVTAPSSWSYSFTAGADVSSANPMARTSLASAQAGSTGNVTVANHSSYSQALYNNTTGAKTTSVTVNLPTMIRTGTGNIAIAAAQDVIMQDTVAPGVIYAAGVNTASLTDPGYSLQTVNGVSSMVPATVDGFLEPRILGYGDAAATAGLAGLYYGPPIAAAFPERGGDVVIDAQRDIVGYSGSGNKVPQYYQPWLLSDTAPSSRALLGEGAFAPSGTAIASQTAWWIQYGSFQQGFLSAGGNVIVNAGRDLVDVSVSLPTTGRVSGGLAASSLPVTHLYGSGNMMVRAGRNILGGSFYEGSGHASIIAGAAIGQNGTVSRFASSKLLLPDLPLLAVDTGQIAMVAQESIAISGVVNPAELQTQLANASNPLQLGAAQLPLYMDTYGPDSKVRLVADSGDLTISIAPTAITDQSVTNIQINAAASVYPASLEALALNGSLVTTGLGTTDTNGKPVNIPTPGIVLSPSAHGTFELLAQDNVDLTFGYPANTSITSNPRPFISAGAALIDTAFDPFQPDSGSGNAFSGAVLAHQDDAAAGIDTVARIYAATGDITATGSYGRRSTNDTSTGYQRVEINRPARIYAGRDIVDLNVIVQNINPSDVSMIEAGRNIYYTGYNNGGGLQVAGPGFFVVQAGGDIGPFLPAAHDNSSEAVKQEGIVSVGNSSPTPVGDIYVSNTGGSIGIYDEALLGPPSNPRRNALLRQPAGSPQGANIITLFGTKFGVDYQAVIDAYINPANASNVDHDYIAELQAFLVRVGKPPSATDAATVFNAFMALPADLQHVFVDQVFFAELKAVGVSQQGGTAQYQLGYRMINTMFPSSLGYTANALGGGTNGANQLVKTGDLNLLHATIQTQLGGDISIFGPGGSVIVGPLAVEPNPNLRLRDLGILTLGGGAINTVTDESVLVNSSRVLTTQGGDILMWSSNADLDAGRGSKTTLSAPALQVLFDQNDYQSIDLGGFVTGAGIAVLQASSVAEASNLYLLAPRGTIDAGTAGIRVSGNAVFAGNLIVNQGNIQVQGTTSGVPVIAVPNVGALTSGSNTAGAAAKSSDTPTAAGGNGDRASVFIVEVVGYGGSDIQGQPASGSDDTKPSDERKR